MRKTYRFLVLLLVLLLSGVTKAQIPQSQTPDTQLSANDEHRFALFFLEAVCQERQGHYSAAFELLRHCLEINPSSAETYFNLASYYNAMNADSMALVCMDKAAALNPDNYTYLERLGQTLIAVDQYDRASGVYEQLSAVAPSRTDVLSILMQLYQMEGNYNGMLHVIDRLELIDGPSEDIALSRMQIYSKQGDKKKEFKVLQELSRQFPNDYNYRVMMGNWLLQNGKKKKALAEYNYVLRKEPDNLMAQMSLLDYYKETKNQQQVNELTEKILVNNNTDTDSKLTLLRQMIYESEQQGGDSTQMLAVFEKLLNVPEPDASVAELCAGYMSLKKMPDKDVEAALERVISIEPDNAGARIELLQLVWKSEDYDRIISLSKPALEYNPDNMAFYYFLGLAHYQKGEKEETLDILRRGVSQINSDSNPALVSDFYEIMGDLLHQKGLDDEAFAAYDSCLHWKADNIGCLNNYAYYLSEKGRDLQKAEKMSYLTIKAEPNSATYLDTYAWILFMQGRYEEARIYIDQAVKNDADHGAVITEHAGDIYMMNDEAEKALEYWRQALEANDEENPLLEQKIKQRKYIAK